jgi:DNA repair protein RecN (Recombination protein N)
MLRELRIQNFAIIDRLEIQFQEQLNVLTGETGSGKSIVVDAVDLLLGGRAASEQVRTGCDEAVLEAAFQISDDGPIARRLRDMDLAVEAGGDLLIRRSLSRAGRSRAQINGRLVTLTQLQQVGDLLVDIHGQHEHQSLLRPDHQLFLLDAFAKLIPLREEYRRRHLAYETIRAELAEMSDRERDRAQREELLRFQSREIESAQLVPDEDAHLERERHILSNAGRLAVLAEDSYQRLYDSDGAILGQLAGVESLIGELAGTDDRMKDLTELCAGAGAQLRDAAERLRDYKGTIEYDPKRLEQIEDRLHGIAALKKKYSPTLEGIRAVHQTINEELQGLSSHSDRLAALRLAIEERRADCAASAQRLTKERTRGARALEKKIEQELGRLKMEKTRFRIRIESREKTDAFGPAGADAVEFLVAPNPGEEPKALARIASGGELSRIMLSLKSVLAALDQVPTLIFDEVDAGIGGAVAEVVGRRLKTLARHRQVLCVTHLPQIASRAETHFTVEKSSSDGRAVTRVRKVVNEARVEEIARMLGGRDLTPTAFKHAREMLDLGVS